MRRLLVRVRSESGQALISSLILLAGVLIPLLFRAALRTSRPARRAEQAARDAVRAAVQSPSPTAAEAALRAVARARSQTRVTPATLEGQFARASVLRARVRTEVDLARIPLFGSIGTVEVSGDAAAPVDRYRSLLGSPSP